MISLNIEDISSFEDIEEYKDQVQTSNPIYFEALKYKRYDVIMELILFPRSSIIGDFVRALKLYKSVGSSYAIDLLTNRYYHHALWTELVNRLEKDGIDRAGISHMKKAIIRDLSLPIPYNGTCYACCRLCKDCEIYKKCGKCDIKGTTYDKLYDAFTAVNRDAAIKYAEEIRDAW